jgi:hypothetical protein
VYVDDDLFIYARELGSRRVMVALNFSHGERALPPGVGEELRPVLSTHLDEVERGVLRADEGLLLE